MAGLCTLVKISTLSKIFKSITTQPRGKQTGTLLGLDFSCDLSWELAWALSWGLSWGLSCDLGGALS
jgi:hypothetical protein